MPGRTRLCGWKKGPAQVLSMPREGPGAKVPHLPSTSSHPPLNLLPRFPPLHPKRFLCPAAVPSREGPAKAGVKRVSRCHITLSAAILPQSQGKVGTQFETETDIIPFILRSSLNSFEPETFYPVSHRSTSGFWAVSSSK